MANKHLDFLKYGLQPQNKSGLAFRGIPLVNQTPMEAALNTKPRTEVSTAAEALERSNSFGGWAGEKWDKATDWLGKDQNLANVGEAMGGLASLGQLYYAKRMMPHQKAYMQAQTAGLLQNLAHAKEDQAVQRAARKSLNAYRFKG